MRVSPFCLLALLVGLAACVPKLAALPAEPIESEASRVVSTPADAGRTPTCETPLRPSDEWETVPPEEVGFDPDAIGQLRRALHSSAYENVHSVLLVKDGKLVFEEYLGAYGPDRTQEVASVTKSVTSILVGIAMDRGFLDGLDQGGLDRSVAALLPEYEALISADVGKENLLFRHILSMSAGLDWDETSIPYGTPGNDCYESEVSRDSAGYVLSKPVVDVPGTVFEYNGGLSNLLSAIMQERTGRQMAEFAAQVLFEPLGVQSYRWDKLMDGRTDAAGGLVLRPRDMAKIGQLVLNGGMWEGTQIVSPEWVAESTRLQMRTGQGPDYGLQWWRGTLYPEGEPVETFFASGHGGQAIYVVPSCDLVVVFTQQVFDNPLGTLLGPATLTRYILPAILGLAPAGQALKMDVDTLDRFVGEYRSGSGGEALTISREGEQLYLVHADVGKVALSPQSASDFTCTVMEVLQFQMAFGDQDPAERVTVYMDFRTEQYERVR